VEESERPLVVLRLDDPSDEGAPDFASFLAGLDRIAALSRETRVRIVLDLTGAKPDADRRRRFAEWLRTQGPDIRPHVDAFAIVAPSAMLRGTITAMRWFFPERMLHSETFDRRDRAVAWARERPSAS